MDEPSTTYLRYRLLPITTGHLARLCYRFWLHFRHVDDLLVGHEGTSSFQAPFQWSDNFDAQHLSVDLTNLRGQRPGSILSALAKLIPPALGSCPLEQQSINLEDSGYRQTRKRILLMLSSLVFFVLLVTVALPTHAEILVPVMMDEPITNIQVIDERLLVSGRQNLYEFQADGAYSTLANNLKITAVLSHNGKIYIGTTHGLYIQGQDKPVVSGIRVTDMAVFQGNIWIGTDRGLYELGLEDPRLLLSVLDLELIDDRLWIGSLSGASWIDSPSAQPIEIEFGDTADPVPRITHAGKKVWLSTLRNAALGRFGPAYCLNINETTATESCMINHEITSIQEIGNSIWFGTEDAGILTLENAKIKYKLENTPINHSVNLIYLSGQGDIYLGTSNGLWRGSAAAGFEELPASASLNIKALIEYESHLWLGTQKGVYRLETNRNVVGRLEGAGVEGEKKWRFNNQLRVEGVGYRSLEAPTEAQLERREDWSWCVLSSTREQESALSLKEPMNCYPATADSSHTLPEWQSTAFHVVYKDPHGNLSRPQQHIFFTIPRWPFLLVLLLPFMAILNHLRRKARQEKEAKEKAQIELHDNKATQMINSLTGLPAKDHGGYEHAAAMFGEIAVDQRPWGMIMIDLDDFGQINKEYGHASGDTVLSAIGRILQEDLREGDYPYRWGGEEFMILIDSPTKEQTKAAAFRLLEKIASTDFKIGKKQVSVTASIGFCNSHECQRDFQLALRVADYAMRKAKKRGKKQVQSASSREFKSSSNEIFNPESPQGESESRDHHD